MMVLWERKWNFGEFFLFLEGMFAKCAGIKSLNRIKVERRKKAFDEFFF